VSQPHPVPSELLSKSAILDALIKGVLLIDHERRVAWINRPLERLLGVDRWLIGDEVAVVEGRPDAGAGIWRSSAGVP